jgi:hypothetical protein
MPDLAARTSIASSGEASSCMPMCRDECMSGRSGASPADQPAATILVLAAPPNESREHGAKAIPV